MPRCSITPNAATCPSLLLLTCDAYLHAWPPRSAIAGPAFALRHPLALLPLPRAAAALLRDRTGRRLTRPTASQAVGAAACPAPHRGTNGRALRCADLSAKTRFTRTEAEHKLRGAQQGGICSHAPLRAAVAVSNQASSAGRWQGSLGKRARDCAGVFHAGPQSRAWCGPLAAWPVLLLCT